VISVQGIDDSIVVRTATESQPTEIIQIIFRSGSEDQAKLNQDRVVQEILKHQDRSNLVIITHDLNIANVVLEDTVPMGEFIVVQPNGVDFEVIGKIRMGE
jgi:uncharacterized protein YaiI (UPF0178 family)